MTALRLISDIELLTSNTQKRTWPGRLECT